MEIHKKILGIMVCAFVGSTILLGGCNGGATLEKIQKQNFLWMKKDTLRTTL